MYFSQPQGKLTSPIPLVVVAHQATDGGDGDIFGAQPASTFTPPVVPSSVSTPSFSAPPVSALVEFNKKFRALCEDKDAKERELKSARRAAGKAALKKLVADRTAVVDARKAKNREEEASKEKEAMDALESEAWGRVVSLIDVHGVAAAAASAAETGSSKKKGEHAEEPANARQKSILIALKNSPLLPVAGM